MKKNKTFYNEIEKLEEIFYGKIQAKKKWLNNLVEYLNSQKINLHQIAVEAKRITENFFGKTILIYAPLYISNYCVNGCLYCGFSALNKIKRCKLTEKDIEMELKFLKEKGFDTVLILTGEDRINSPFEYIRSAVRIASKYFSEVLIEVYPLDESEYKKLVKDGIVGVTLYQETYDKELYKKLHPFGPKKDYSWRLSAIERALNAGIKEVSIGALLGLNENWRYDVFMSIAHADYLQTEYPDAEINLSFPRIRKSVARNECFSVSDRDFVKSIILSRIFLPRVGINITTREDVFMRDNLIGLGMTRMSAESKTTVGGYYKKDGNEVQFEVSDTRSLDDILRVLKNKGYRAEFTNWVKTK
ncbi:MAG: 2-iminoacetate synthase ThiH [Elusimicrobiales bacterium]